MNNWSVDEIVGVCCEAAKIAMEYYSNPPMELKSDNSVVTAADKAIEQYLISRLVADEDSYFIGEETVAERGEDYINAALRAEACWIVDPIDGTAPYSCMFPAWGHSSALMHNGVISDGAIYLPVQDVLLITDGSDVWHYRNLRNPEATVREKFHFQNMKIDIRRPVAVAQRYAKYRKIELENQVFCWSGCVAASYYLLTGKLLAYLAVVKLWDIAAVAAIMSRSNYIGINEFGREVSLNVDESGYELACGTKDRWRLRGATVFAANNDIAGYIWSKVE